MTDVVFEDVTKQYGAVRAVDGLSVEIDDGSFTTILGPSGSGKTTMLSLMSGIEELTSGRIVLGGRDITHVPARSRDIGLVFQSYALFPHMSVFDNVAYPLRLRRKPKSETERLVTEALDLVRLGAFADRRPSALSGGQQQRVAIARAVVFSPSLLLLDEPLSALDRNLREEVRVELRGIQRKLGITTIMVTHDQEEALSLSDRIVLLRDGKVQQVGRPSDLYHRPDTRFVAEFLGTAGFIEGTWCDGFIVTSGGARLPAPPPPEGFDAKCLTALLRADAVSLCAPEDGHPALVDDVEFLGDAVRYGLRLENGPRLYANAPGQIAAQPEGTRVGVRWNADDLRYVAEATPPPHSGSRSVSPEAGRANIVDQSLLTSPNRRMS